MVAMEDDANRSHPLRAFIIAAGGTAALWIGRLSNVQTVAGVVNDGRGMVSRILGVFPMLSAEILEHSFYVVATALMNVAAYQLFKPHIDSLVFEFCGKPLDHKAKRYRWM